jgi:hypothetical protein
MLWGSDLKFTNATMNAVLRLLMILLFAPVASAEMGRICIREGRFMDKSTSQVFRPFGSNHYRLGSVDAKKQGHSAYF